MKSVYVVFAIFTLLISCSTPEKFVKFTPKPGDIYTDENLKTFLKSNSQPNIVLRVPNAYEDVTTKSTNEKVIAVCPENETMDIYYNAIEKSSYEQVSVLETGVCLVT